MKIFVFVILGLVKISKNDEINDTEVITTLSSGSVKIRVRQRYTLKESRVTLSGEKILGRLIL